MDHLSNLRQEIILFSLLKIIFAFTSSLKLLLMPFLEVDAYVSSKLEN